MIRKRTTLRRGELTSDEKAAVRKLAYIRARGRCEIQGDGKCQGEAPLEHPSDFVRGQLVHLRNKRMWGWGPENVCWGCRHCHMDLAHWGKIKLPKTYSELLKIGKVVTARK